MELSSNPDFVAVGALPWVLLRATATAEGPSGDSISNAIFVQRLNTTAGVEPSTGCGSSGNVGNQALCPARWTTCSRSKVSSPTRQERAPRATGRAPEARADR